MEERTYESIVMKYKDTATTEDMIRLTKLTNDFVEDPYDRDEFLDKVESELCYFLTEKEAKYYVDMMENENPSHPKGGKWTKAQTLQAFEQMGYPKSSARYSENGVYYACNMVYSDYYPMYEDEDEKYLEHAYLFLNDKDYKGHHSKEKWYARK